MLAGCVEMELKYPDPRNTDIILRNKQMDA